MAPEAAEDRSASDVFRDAWSALESCDESSPPPQAESSSMRTRPTRR
ncbi:MAG: hypothetical protein HOY76_43360 [Streptomyces sp.]|nr:hypothetical protein [Streptomyces sp.]